MQVPTILKGDDSGPIVLVMDEAHDYTGSTLVVAYAGVTRKFTNLTPGGSVSLSFTHEETSRFNIGCKPVLMRLIGPSGAVETVENAALKIKVTDCLGEVNAGGSFVIKPGTQAGSVPVTDLGDIPTTANVSALYAKVNEIIRVLAQRSLLAFAVCLTTIAFATVQTTTLGNLNPSSVVVTNVTESGSVISDGTNAIDAAGNTYTNGVKSGKLRARDDRIWGEYGYSEPVSSFPGANFLSWEFVGGYQDPNLWKFFFTFGGRTWSVYTFPPDPDWTVEELEYQAIVTEDGGDFQYWQNGPISFTRRPLFDRFALESQLPGSGSNLDTNTVADIANHAIATNATVSGLTSQVSSLSSSKRDVDDNNFSGEFWLQEGDLNIFSPFGIFAHFAHIRGYDTLDEGWSNITVTASGSTETLPEYLDRNISTNNPVFVAAVLNTPSPSPGEEEDPPWGTYGTLGAAIAGIIAALKLMVKKITCGTLEVSPTNGVADLSELFSESDTSTAANPDLNNKVLQASVNKLIDAKVGAIDDALDALNGEVA